MKGGIWPIKAEKSPDERPHPSPKHRNKQKCQGESSTSSTRIVLLCLRPDLMGAYSGPISAQVTLALTAQ